MFADFQMGSENKTEDSSIQIEIMFIKCKTMRAIKGEKDKKKSHA